MNFAFFFCVSVLWNWTEERAITSTLQHDKDRWFSSMKLATDHVAEMAKEISSSDILFIKISAIWLDEDRDETVVIRYVAQDGKAVPRGSPADDPVEYTREREFAVAVLKGDPIALDMARDVLRI